jgi:hypothetical protein
VAVSCSAPETRIYGTITGTPSAIAIPDLLSSPEIHLGKEVAVQGVVAQVCQEMGCWFELSEASGRLMVDLQMGRHFTVPKESEGLRARVEGTFVREDGVLKLIGRGVELKPAPGA